MLNLLKQLDMPLADLVLDCGCILHGWRNHCCVGCSLDWDGAVLETMVSQDEAYMMKFIHQNI